MTRTKTIIISILLITSAIIITMLSNSQLNNGLIRFFSGFVFGTGLSILIQAIIKKKTDSN